MFGQVLYLFEYGSGSPVKEKTGRRTRAPWGQLTKYFPPSIRKATKWLLPDLAEKSNIELLFSQGDMAPVHTSWSKSLSLLFQVFTKA